MKSLSKDDTALAASVSLAPMRLLDYCSCGVFFVKMESMISGMWLVHAVWKKNKKIKANLMCSDP